MPPLKLGKRLAVGEVTIRSDGDATSSATRRDVFDPAAIALNRARRAGFTPWLRTAGHVGLSPRHFLFHTRLAWIALLVGLIASRSRLAYSRRGRSQCSSTACLRRPARRLGPPVSSCPFCRRQSRPGRRPRAHRHDAADHWLCGLDGAHDDQLSPQLPRHDAGPLRPLRQAPGARPDLSSQPAARRRDLPADHGRVRAVGHHGHRDRHRGRCRDAHRHDRHPAFTERLAHARGVHGRAIHDLE